MKNIKLRSVILLVSLLVVITTQSCKKEEQPTPVVYKAYTTPVLSTSPAVKPDGTVFVTGSTVDLKWVSETGSNGDNWTVYVTSDAGDDKVVTGVTKQMYTLTVEDGVTYTWHVEAVDKNGIKTTSPEDHFTAIKGTNPDMNVSLTVATNALAAIGMNLTADQVVDLRLLIVKKVDQSLIEAVDNGYANEEYTDFGTLPDGEYQVGVDIIATINAGDFNKPISLSFSLAFDQLGITDLTLAYPNVMTNVNPCILYRTYLATVTKVGAEYTIKREVSNVTPPVVEWNGTDATYPSEVTTTASCKGKSMTGLGFGWMLDWWGEVIVSGGTLTYTTTATTITIPLQKYCKTTYNGAAQPEYSIEGSGTIDNSGAYPVYTIQYDYIQSGASIAEICMDYGWETPYFEAILTTGPGGKIMSTTVKRIPRPIR